MGDVGAVGVVLLLATMFSLGALTTYCQQHIDDVVIDLSEAWHMCARRTRTREERGGHERAASGCGGHERAGPDRGARARRGVGEPTHRVVLRVAAERVADRVAYLEEAEDGERREDHIEHRHDEADGGDVKDDGEV